MCDGIPKRGLLTADGELKFNEWEGDSAWHDG